MACLAQAQENGKVMADSLQGLPLAMVMQNACGVGDATQNDASMHMYIMASSGVVLSIVSLES